MLTFFFIFFLRPPCKNTARGHGGLQKKKKVFALVVLHNRDWTALFQNCFALAVNFFSALQIKDKDGRFK